MKNYLLPVIAITIFAGVIISADITRERGLRKHNLNFVDPKYRDSEISIVYTEGFPETPVSELKSEEIFFPVNDLVCNLGKDKNLMYDNPYDNSVTISINKDLSSGYNVYLEYDLYGLNDYTSVCRSINDFVAGGGLVVTSNKSWSHQREKVSANQFNPGDNLIRFSVPEGTDINYSVKNVRILTEKTSDKEKSIEINQNLQRNYFGQYAYISGFVNGPGSKDVTVYANNKKVNCYKGVFEGVISLDSGVADKETVIVKALYSDGTSVEKEVRFSNNSPYDYINTDLYEHSYVESAAFPDNSFELNLNSLYLKAKAGCVTQNLNISVTGLRSVDMPLPDAGMINVTAVNSGYRCLPHGTIFETDVELGIKYDRNLIPAGYGPEDIRTFYFNEVSGKWVMLEMDSIDIANNLIISKTNHFTDFINAILKTPELPQTEAFTPTSLKDMKYADPLAGVNIMGIPSANNNGTANMSFPLQIPAGRHGMQPQLAISYSSDNANGWLGVGWGLSVPSISIDTRWGVPRFYDTLETEEYLVNGEQIIELGITSTDTIRFPLMHKDTLRHRGTATETFYSYRTEGAFHRIIRHRTSAADYWWEVIDKNGVKYLYGKYNSDSGVNQACVLSNPQNGNITQWALTEIRDLYGNYVKYEYDTVTSTATHGAGGRQIYLKKITYTGFGTTDGKYTIEFTTDDRTDYFISGRSGFPETTDKLLKNIYIRYDNEFIRAYFLNYIEGAYKKNLLKSITDVTDSTKISLVDDIDCDDLVQYSGAITHCFDYYVEEGMDFNSNAVTATSALEDNDTIMDVVVVDSVGQTLGKSRSSSGYIGGSGGLGFDENYFSKSNSIGPNSGFSLGMNQEKSQLIDLNGDGLTDKIVKRHHHYDYYKGELNANNELIFSSTPYQIQGLNLRGLGRCWDKTFNIGGEIMLDILSISASANYLGSFNRQANNRYFADVNADGFVDYIYDDDVYFNKPDIHGNPLFSLVLLDNPRQYYDDSCSFIIYDGELCDFSITDEDEISNNRRDPVKMWVAQSSGKVDITSVIKRINPNKNTNDMVYYSIQKEGVYYDFQLCNSISDSDTSTYIDTITSTFDVKEEEVIYFRLHSNNSSGADDFKWDITIKCPTGYVLTENLSLDYTDADEKLIYVYNSAEDAVIHDNQYFVAPFSGTLNIEGNIVSPAQSDSLNFIIKHNNTSIIDTVYEDAIAFSRSFNFNRTVNQGDSILFKLLSSSNVNWNDIDFNAKIQYDSIIVDNTTISDSLKYYPTLQMSLFTRTLSLSRPVSLASGTYNVFPTLDAIYYNDGEIVFTAKSKRNLLAKKTITIENGSYANYLSVLHFTLDTDDTVFFDYFVKDINVFEEVDSSFLTETTGAAIFGSPSTYYKTGIHYVYPDTLQKFGNLYRGWGQFSYLDKTQTGSCYLVDESKLYIYSSSVDSTVMDDFPFDDIDETTDYDDLAGTFNDYNVNGNDSILSFAVMRADRKEDRWVDAFQVAYVDRENMGSGLNVSTIYSLLDDPSIFELEVDYKIPDFNNPVSPNSLVPTKMSKQSNNSFSVGAGAGPADFSFTHTNTKTKCLVDFTDLNGDRYPDVVGTDKIQFTTAQGGISKDTIFFPETFISLGEAKANGSAFGVKSTVYKGTSTNTGKKGKLNNITGSFGIGTNTGNSDVSFIYFDINGDGLPDRVDSENDSVQLNLGYGFTPPVEWDVDTLGSNLSISFSLNLGNALNYDNFSLSGGFGGSYNWNFDNFTQADVNNDGLSDICYLDNNDLMALINTGSGFYIKNISPSFNKSVGKGSSINISANASETYGTPFTTGKMVFAGYQDYSFSVCSEKVRLTDLNGDGFLDYAYVDDNYIKVNYGIPKKTNLLKEVICPAKSSYTIDYSRTYPDIKSPDSKWVMASLETFDGFAGDGENRTYYRYEYSGAKYDRIERESHGFDTVITKQYDNFTDNNLYRTLLEAYHTDKYILKGLKKYEVNMDAGNNKYVETFYTWNYLFISTGDIIEDPDICAYDYYPALSREDKYFYEGQSTSQIHTVKNYYYGPYGNVKQYVNYNDNSTNADNIRGEIDYDYNITNNLLAMVTELKVYNSQNGLMRRTTGDYNSSSGSIVRISRYEGANAAITDLTYDQYGNVTRIEYPADINNDRLEFDYVYDPVINTYPVTISDYWGNASYHEYDYKLGLPTRITDPSGNEMRYSYYYDGKTDSITGPNEVVNNVPYTIKCEYWSILDNSHPYLWALTRHYDPINTGNEFLSVNICDGMGRTVQSKKTATVEGVNTVVVSGPVIYDEFGRQISVSQPVTEAYSDIYHFVAFSTVVSSNPSTISYDLMDRALVKTAPDNTTVEYEYGFGADAFSNTSFKTIITDQNSIVTEQFTDARGLQTSVTAPLNTITKFEYSPLGELLFSTDPEDNKTSYKYDMLGRMFVRTHPDANNTSYTYDLAGNVQTVVTENLNAVSEEIQYVYEDCRLKEIHYPVNPEMDVYYEYGHAGTGNQSGRLVKQQDASGVQEFYYGNMGELIENIHTFVVPDANGSVYTFRTGWQYDSWNRLKTITYPDGELVTYNYDNGGKLLTMSGNKGGTNYPYVTGVTYNKYGSRTRINYGNNTYIEYTYNPQTLRLYRLQSNDCNGDKMQYIRYTYDLAGNITGIVNSCGFVTGNLGGSYTYSNTYDDLYRLTESNGSFVSYGNGTRTYDLDMSYSGSGNILNKTLSAQTLINGSAVNISYNSNYTYNDRPHNVTATNLASYSWDLNGNMIYRRNDEGERFMCWDEENRLVAVRDVAKLSQASVYLYDAGGERVWKLTGTETQIALNAQTVYTSIYFFKTLYASPLMVMTDEEYTKHYYIEGERVCSKIGGGFGVAPQSPTGPHLSFIAGDASSVRGDLKHLVFDDLLCVGYNNIWNMLSTLPPALNTANDPENLRYFYHPDHLGSSSMISNISGHADQHIQYLPFGELFVSQRNSSFDSRYKFTAKELDNETNYTYFGARYYDSDLSNWLSVDPMSDKYPNLNPYAYCANNPVIFFDPNGEYIWIFYKDDNGEIQSHKFNPEENYKGNDFVESVYLAYNFFKENGVEELSLFDSFVNDKYESININEDYTTHFTVNSEYKIGSKEEQTVGTVYWNKSLGYKFKNDYGQKGRRSPAEALLHEMGHGYTVKTEGFKTYAIRSATYDRKFGNIEQGNNIMLYENPAAEKLGSPPRTDGKAKSYITTGVTSTLSRKESIKNGE